MINPKNEKYDLSEFYNEFENSKDFEDGKNRTSTIVIMKNVNMTSILINKSNT